MLRPRVISRTKGIKRMGPVGEAMTECFANHYTLNFTCPIFGIGFQIILLYY